MASVPRRRDGRVPAPILVVGDLICDHYIWGDVERVSPEAPVQVLRWEREANRAGGAANVALNLAALGCEVRLGGVVGHDAEGRWLLGALGRGGIDTAAVVKSTTRATTRKDRIIARGQQLLRVDREERQPLAPRDERALLAELGRHRHRAAGIVVSDYAKGVLSRRVLARLLRPTGRARHRPRVLVDPKGSDFTRYRGADILTPNERELRKATPEADATPQGADGALVARARAVHASTGARALLVTRGRHGMDLFEFGADRPTQVHVPVFQTHEVFDITGAGDTVAAVMARGAFDGQPLAEAARMATVAAGLVLGSVGTSVVDRDALERVRHGPSAPSGTKILTRATLKRRVADARAHGARVVLTNGCFDLLHAGHLHLLQRARALGDLLVVAVNDDRSVRRLKGRPRPLVNQDDRAELLAALRVVDYVTIFREPTPLGVIEAVRPDVLVKGADYAIDEVVGREVVARNGGRVELIALLPGVSTTALVKDRPASHATNTRRRAQR